MFPWKAVIFVLAVAAVSGWVYFHFYWRYQLPQNRTLTDLQGHAITGRLVACNKDVIQYVSKDDNSTQYVAVSTLSGTDQEFVQHLDQQLKFAYPFECQMGPDGAKPALVRIEGRNDDWVKYTSLDDHATHYAPISAFSTSDQIVLQQLPDEIRAEFPISYTVKDTQGKILADTILGRSNTVVKLGLADGAERYVPLSELSALDQKLVQLAGPNVYLNVPLECILTDNTGKTLNLRIEGRSASTIKYTLLSDGLTYYAPLTDFSTLDQKILRMLPSDLVFRFPFEYTLTGPDGKPMRVQLEGRTPNIVEYTLMADGRNYYLPMTSFTAEDQKFLQLLPADLRLEFPLDYTLISQSGQALQAHLLGRSNDAVKFTLDDGKTYNYPLSNLSAESVAFLQMVPANLVEADMVADAPPPTPPPAQTPNPEAPSNDPLPGLRNQLGPLVTDDLTMQAQVDAMPIYARTATVTRGQFIPSTNPARDQLLSKLDANRNKIASICTQINVLLVKNPKATAATIVDSYWNQIMLLIKHNDDQQVNLSTAGPNVRDPILKEIRDNGKQIDALLGKINAATGVYGP